MSISDVLDLDFMVAVKSNNKFFAGYIFVEEDYQAYFKFDTTTLTHTIDKFGNSVSNVDLIEIFETHPAILNEIMIIESENIIEIGTEIVNKNVYFEDGERDRSIRTILDRFEECISIQEKIFVLNELMIQRENNSNKDKSNKGPKILSYSRKIHVMKNQYDKTFRRVVIPKKIMNLLFDKMYSLNYSNTYVISLNPDMKKMDFTLTDLSEFQIWKEEEYFSKLIDNHDGTMRVNISDDILDQLTKDNRIIIIDRPKDYENQISFKIINS